MTPVFIGCDFGQARDYTALVALERQAVGGKVSYHIRYLERLPLGTSYPAQVTEIKKLVTKLLPREVHLTCDETGVGRPVIDMLRKEGLKPIPVTITGGLGVTTEGGSWRVPKRDLVSNAQVLLQNGTLKISSKLPLANILTSELLNFKVTISKTGHDTYAADTVSWREGEHDDTVLACALALWWAVRWKKPEKTHSTQRTGNWMSHSWHERRRGIKLRSSRGYRK
jgi:hypothetical protein